MNCRSLRSAIVPLCTLAALALLLTPQAAVWAQEGGDASSEQSALVDLTGTWVSLVSEDWGVRMVTPAKGDYRGIPLNEAGRRMADDWDPAAVRAAGEECKAYGAPAIMRVPTRLNISWDNETTLKIETDAGMQTRTFYFGEVREPEGPTYQGHSLAEWVLTGGEFGYNPGGHLKVVTTHLRPGFLRKNGVPYSAEGVMTEYFYRFEEPYGDSTLFVVTMFEDEQYLEEPLALSTQFKKIPDGSGWNPTPCTAD
jgi:hypothetical protein